MYDQGDTSWKVRRSAIQVTDTLIRMHPELLHTLALTVFDKLVKRFTEHEQNVKLDTFSTLSNFLKMIAYGEALTDSEENLEELMEMPKLYKLKSSFLEFSNKI